MLKFRYNQTLNFMRYAIGVDLGGTCIKYAVIDENGKFHYEGKLPSKANTDSETVVRQLILAIEECMEYASNNKINLLGVGIGTPGIVDETQRTVLGGAENINGWINVPLASLVEFKTSLPTIVHNDANLMGLGEATFGAARGCSDVIFITVGTGIGGAVIIDGKLFCGYKNRGTELGHIPLIFGGDTCSCGSIGCLETYASTSALVRRFTERAGSVLLPNNDINGKMVIDLYKQGHPMAKDSLEEHWQFLGQGISAFINIFSPQKVVIGGGISESGDFYIENFAKSAKKYAIDTCAINTEIVRATLGNKAGSMGAACLVFNKFPNI